VNRIRLAVLFGGCSTEYDVSLQSTHAVIQGLDRDLYDVTLLGITRQGQWLKYDGPPENIAGDTWMQHPSCVPAIIPPDRGVGGILVLAEGQPPHQIPVDVVFPVFHGKNGEDGTVQGLLELAGIPYVGCGVLSSAAAMDKEVAHRLVAGAGIPTPPSVVLHAPLPGRELLDRTAHLAGPLFVKPAKGGSSIGITKVVRREDLPAAVAAAFAHDDKVVIEAAVDGVEVGCAVVGNQTLIMGAVDEVEVPTGFFDYEEKYTLASSRIHMPARIDAGTTERIKAKAAVIYRVLQCRGLARVDMFLTPDGQIVFNEVNTIPGFTPQSRFPHMLQGIGWTFPQIIDHVIRLALAP